MQQDTLSRLTHAVRYTITVKTCLISHFRRGVNKIFALHFHYTHFIHYITFIKFSTNLLNWEWPIKSGRNMSAN